MATQTSLVTGVDFITVPTKDIDQAVEFYGEVLGLERSKQWGDMPAHEFETGNLTIVIWEPEAFGQEFETHRDPIAFQVDDVEAAMKELEGQGVEFEGEIIDSGVCHQVIFRDPDGNMLDLHHRYAPKDAALPTTG
jgi:catechol 2,3-dioxygenase-like lactoylglutathione lyase family enzyme